MTDYKRGLSYADCEIAGSRILLVHNSRGELLLECHVRADFADEQTESCLWWWLDQHDDEREFGPEFEAPSRPSLTVSDGGNKPPRKSKSKRQPAPPQPTVLH
jgi:hypothetical protein